MTYRIALFAIRLVVPLKEFSVNASPTIAALKALFVIDFAKGRAAFYRDGLGAHPAFANGFIHRLGHPVANLGLNFRIIEPVIIGALRPVVLGLVSWIGTGNGPVKLWRCQTCARGRFSFGGRHLHAGVTCCWSRWSTSSSR